MTKPQSLSDQYDTLWRQAHHQFSQGSFELDPFLASKTPDTRRGITLLARPNPEVQTRIQEMLQRLKVVEPSQYYYPAQDLHLTLLSIISCLPDFDSRSIQAGDYCRLLQEALHGIQPFIIYYKGITASPSCIMVQGFPDGEGLQQLREQVRTAFKNSDLPHTIDQRYEIHTAHSTVLRFQAPLKNPAAFLSLLEQFRATDFGSFTIEQVELVYNDWYQRASNTQTLATFQL
ncbi:hypothetical protein TH61_05645 [Rufibacter sp. DG15C]|uniref:2'-5' RNA ligase family protein n=1 Tax=Rufibacter sp. DG15C TaxID=1379909 RepID=UPI00078E43B0|nr:2'-5' RNA ligase family protein [Rufibacter sp. DG15C]AMM50767.1 hypothetical protein TH61_05645 [Rufibacter sp. DG15C]